MLLNSTDLSKSFSFGMLLINERLSLIPPSHGGWFFGLLLSRSLFIYIKWVISQNLERGCSRMRFYRILVAVPLKYKKYQEI